MIVFCFDISWMIWIAQSYILYAVLHLLKTNSVKTDLILICTKKSVTFLNFLITRTNNDHFQSPKITLVAEQTSCLAMTHMFSDRHLNEKKNKAKTWGFRPWNFPVSDCIALHLLWHNNHAPVLTDFKKMFMQH